MFPHVPVIAEKTIRRNVSSGHILQALIAVTKIAEEILATDCPAFVFHPILFKSDSHDQLIAVFYEFHFVLLSCLLCYFFKYRMNNTEIVRNLREHGSIICVVVIFPIPESRAVAVSG